MVYPTGFRNPKRSRGRLGGASLTPRVTTNARPDFISPFAAACDGFYHACARFRTLAAPESRRLVRRMVRFPTTNATGQRAESRRLARRMVRFPTTNATGQRARIPPARPADSSVSHYKRDWPARRIPPARPRIVRFPTTNATGQLARIPPARPADSSVSHYQRDWPARPNPAGSPGG